MRRTPIRWTRGQGPQRRGTDWHLATEDRPDGSTVTWCGRRIVQSDCLALTDYRTAYLADPSPAWPLCPHCAHALTGTAPLVTLAP